MSAKDHNKRKNIQMGERGAEIRFFISIATTGNALWFTVMRAALVHDHAEHRTKGKTNMYKLTMQTM